MAERLARCRREQVTVHSALCTAFIVDQSHVRMKYLSEAAAISLAYANEREPRFTATSAVADPNEVLPGVVLLLGEDSITGWAVMHGEPRSVAISVISSAVRPTRPPQA